MTPSPIVAANANETAVALWGFPPLATTFLSAEAARQMAADLIRAAERIERTEAMTSQKNLKLTGPRS